jgi:hypothetical protein
MASPPAHRCQSRHQIVGLIQALSDDQLEGRHHSLMNGTVFIIGYTWGKFDKGDAQTPARRMQSPERAKQALLSGGAQDASARMHCNTYHQRGGLGGCYEECTFRS